MARCHGLDLCLDHLGLHLHLLSHRLGLLNAQLEKQTEPLGAGRNLASHPGPSFRQAHGAYAWTTLLAPAEV